MGLSARCGAGVECIVASPVPQLAVITNDVAPLESVDVEIIFDDR